ncbi:fungal-specific transcription factor domain-containing protein [Cercophora newfieldiana]|uniref:Fungal-specific transcription factor domain-containing protein n=1 Tax=Cercophora newfieldiana TaxID=92897 RepID=A0AA40CJ94_9PEZI|nr:fungal-specific transcription factor domain-containing protein [Cercophora newfieldiana]
MKNKQKSRSGCQTCKHRRPSCHNCTQKNFDCPGYERPLKWSTKHEKPWNATVSGPENFSRLVTTASEVISKSGQSSSSRSPTTRVTSPPSPGPQSSGRLDDGDTLVPIIKREETPGAEMPDNSILQPVVDIPSFLIEHWFQSVCGSWSALDSHANPYRTLTYQLWSTSTLVFHALQAISAASLVERLPAVIWDTARTAPSMATEAIKKELVSFSTGKNTKFPSELLLALFCMSSSMAWRESRELGLRYLRQARGVLKTLETWELSDEGKRLFEFFRGCLIYEEMLRSVVSQDEVDLKNMLSWPEPPETALVKAVPHPWSGVSTDVFRLFGKAVALCKRSRTRWRHNGGTSFKLLQGAMKDMEEAISVEEALLAISAERTDSVHLPVHDCDLRSMTDAYRLSSLLQLYENFPDLAIKHMPNLADADTATVWNAWVTPLALQITAILQGLSASCMSRIQPLLCLCTSSGLRFESKVHMTTRHQSYLLNAEGGGKPPTAIAMQRSISPEPETPLFDPNVTPNSIKILQARCFLLGRLEKLELRLPSKPIDVAKQLIRAVWSAYDEEIGTPRRTHWQDVMSDTGLHSVFG